MRVVRDRRYQYHRNFMPHLTWSQFTSYTEEMPTMKAWRQLANEGKLTGPPARYFLPTKPVEELYDNDTDSDQINNLATDAKYRDTLERLRAECDRWMKATGDLGLLPEPEMQVRATGSTPWDIAADPAKNPLPELLDAVDIANQMKPANVPHLVALLGNRDSAVRWWGATGLAALGKNAAPAAAALRKTLTDDSPSVRIAAAEAVGNLGDYAAALPVLTQAIQDDVPLVRLAAMNVLDRFGPPAAPALPAVRAAVMDSKDPIADYLNRMADYLSQNIVQPGK